MAYKTFVNGFPLNASELNNNFMNQVISTFADASARSTAIAAPVEGQITYLTGTNDYWKWDGSAWVELEALSPDFTATSSPNYIINGAFDVWQRGTSFISGSPYSYTADRFASYYGTSEVTFSQSTDVPTGFDYSFKTQRTSGTTTTGLTNLIQFLENGKEIAGKTVTLSFYAKAGADLSYDGLQSYIQTSSGAHGSFIINSTGFYESGRPDAFDASVVHTLTTSWARYEMTADIPSNADAFQIMFRNNPTGTAGADDYFEITGVQLEAGSVATPFKRNAPSLQGELAACQRYYVRFGSSAAYDSVCAANGLSATLMRSQIPLPSEMRAAPTFSTSGAFHTATGNISVTPSLATGNSKLSSVTWTGTGINAYSAYYIRNNNDAAAYFDFSAEL